MPKTLFLIDGHAQVYRAFHAVEGLTAPDGRPTGAAYGFTRVLLDVINRHHPDYLVAVFDAPGKTFRHETYPEYKATRKPTPPELLQQIPVIMDIVRAYQVPVISIENYEADDTLGTLARIGAGKGLDVVLVTSDKDCGQLLGDNVRMYDPRKDLFTTAREYEEKKGIRPDQLPDVMGLWGDSSDNIPGVPGIGEKIGVQLIQKYGSLEKLLHHAAEVKGKRGEKLRECADLARLSKDLATIRTDVPLEFDVDSAKLSPPDLETLVPLFEDLGFHSLLAQLQESKPEEKEERSYLLVNTPEAFDAFLKALSHETEVAFDTETTSLDPMQSELVGMSFSWAAHSGYYLPFRAPEGETTLGNKELETIGKLLADPKIRKTGHNLKYDALVLRRAGLELNGIGFDSLLASNIIGANTRTHGLDSLATRYFGLTKIATKDLIGSGKKQITMDHVPLPQICDYACEDADVAFRLKDMLSQELEKNEERHLLDELELPLSHVLTDMQYTGIRVDKSVLAKQSRELGDLLESLTEEIYSLAGHEFNIASPKQLGTVLFEEMEIPVVRKTKTGPSTDEAVLNQLAGQGHEIAEAVLSYRMYSKLKSTYLDALPQMINPDTGRIHTTFSQTTTATGRLSSRDPNLQNIPIRTERGRAVREAFIPKDGWKMIAADYSQVELRMLAHYSGDEVLKHAFAEGKDIHRVVAAEVNDIDEDEVTTEQRSAAKAINFGIIYGQTPHGLSGATGMTVGQARLFIDSYFEQFPRVKDFIDETIFAARRDGMVKTYMGRRREIPELQSNNKMRLARAEREAVNTVIQGSAADLIKIAMINLHASMAKKTPRSRMLLQIHDELVFETPDEELETLQSLVRNEMEEALNLDVPLTVDMGCGKNWLEVK